MKGKNKTPAAIQITCEQLLREAFERQEHAVRLPKLNVYRRRKRKGFEELIRRDGSNVSVWIKYAHWEEKQGDFSRARSVWERSLEEDYKNHTLWLKYAEMEMKNKFINHARTYGIVQSPCCQESISYGTSIFIWRRCWGMWPVRGSCSRGGWVGYLIVRAGFRTLNLN